MVQSYKSGRDFRVGSGSGLSLSKYFGSISGLHTKVFYNIQSNDFFSWRRFVVLTAVTSMSEVIVLRLIMFARCNLNMQRLLILEYDWLRTSTTLKASQENDPELSLVSLNSNDCKEYWHTKVISRNGLNSKRMKLEQCND